MLPELRRSASSLPQTPLHVVAPRGCCCSSLLPVVSPRHCSLRLLLLFLSAFRYSLRLPLLRAAPRCPRLLLLTTSSSSLCPPCRGSCSLPRHPDGQQGQGVVVSAELALLH
ncbi:hypothetical protein ZWY2020_003717 [Hordeum vulgare]|nr:hypothetical protein ZWY2020_003717 [Hordeum vulgare]